MKLRFNRISITGFVFACTVGSLFLCQTWPKAVSAFVTANNLPTSGRISAVINHHPLKPSASPTNITKRNSSERPEDAESPENSYSGTINPLRLAVLKLGLTELRYTSPLNYEKRPGIYTCAGCGCNLFTSRGKYDSGSGWPSFWRTSGDARSSEGGVRLKREFDGRIECSCTRCGGHLGHVFPDGPKRNEVEAKDLEGIPETDLQTSNPENAYSRLPRYCINGATLNFKEEE